MSIPVDLEALGGALERHHTAYLLTGGDARPHVAQVFPRLVDGLLVIEEPGRTARRRVPEVSAVTVMMPPVDQGGYTLIIDGDAVIRSEGSLALTPTHAVLHRASPQDTGEGVQDSACGNDCLPIGADTSKR